MLVIFSSLTKLSSPVNARTHLKPLNFLFLAAKKSKKTFILSEYHIPYLTSSKHEVKKKRAMFGGSH